MAIAESASGSSSASKVLMEEMLDEDEGRNVGTLRFALRLSW